MRTPDPLPRSLGTAFSVATALEAGATRDRLRARDLARPFTGARAREEPHDLRAQAMALAPILHPDQYFSHTTAAELLGLRMPERRLPLRLHLTYPDAHRAMRRPGVVGHKTLRPARVVRLDGGIPVSAPLAAWCESAPLLGVDELIAMGDGLVCRRSPVASLDDLRDAVQSRAGQRGAARLRLALPHIRPGTDSFRETLLRLVVVRGGFPEPEVNPPLIDRRGVVIAHGDLAWLRYRVVLEYEGRQHAEDADQFAIDIRRLDDLAAADYRVIRVDRRLLRDEPKLLAIIAEALIKGGWRP
ncbi:MAG TPA: hypothetical protein VNS80_09730 [Pseudolysinimonas sp.]|nr:hypothetical protein [Pseudolysinimonas sp.]